MDGSTQALRLALAGSAFLATFLWWRRQPRAAGVTLLFCAAAALAFWLSQIVLPFGYEAGRPAARDWAQAGVNTAGRSDEGFVAGTTATPSLPATLAAAGVPWQAVARVPQAVAVCVLAFAWFAGTAAPGSPRTRWFARCLTVAGGCWPALTGHAVALARPSTMLIILAAGGATVVALRLSSKRTRRGAPLPLLVVIVALGLAEGGPWGLGVSGLAAILATVSAAPTVRLWCRDAARAFHRSPRFFEAIAIAFAFCGGGLVWWNPPQSLPGFHAARADERALRGVLRWIRANVAPDEVVIAHPGWGETIAVLAHRRVLFAHGDDPAHPDLPEPFRRARLYSSTMDGAPVPRLAAEFRATHLFLGPGEALRSVIEDRRDEPRGALSLVYEDADDFRIYRLVTQ